MTIGIVGLGYVGLPLAVAFAEAGQRVVGVDTNVGRVNQLRTGESYIEDIPSERLQAVASRIEATTRAQRLGLCDAIIIAVPTPLTVNREPELGPLIGAAQTVADALRPGQLVVLESTTYPGTTRERVLPILEETGLRAGRDFYLAFSPERVDPGNETYDLGNTPKIIGGLTPTCRDRAEAIYGLVCEQVVPVSSPEVAEMAKLLENIFRSVNIALVNELARLADRMEFDIREVIDAAATKPFGFMRFEPGPGMGGHCLPVDPFYLSWKARELDFATEFIELAGKVNQSQPYFCVEQAERALNEQGKAVRGSKIAVLGVAYKPAVGDIRESPALKIIDRLQSPGRRDRLPRPLRFRAEGLRPPAHRAGRGPRGRRPGAHRHGPPRHRPRQHRRDPDHGGLPWRHAAAACGGTTPGDGPAGAPRRAVRAHGGGSMKRLVIVADHSFVVHAIRLALRQTAGFQVVGFIDGRSPAVGALNELRPDVVVVDDMQLPENAIARLREAFEHAPDAKRLLLTMRMDEEWLSEAFDAGADGVLSKSVHPVSMGTMLREIAQGNVVQRFRASRPAVSNEDCPLTDREKEILGLAAEGYTNQRIARELWVTEQTVKFHLSNTYRKLGVANRTEATRYAYMHDLVIQHERLAS